MRTITSHPFASRRNIPVVAASNDSEHRRSRTLILDDDRELRLFRILAHKTRCKSVKLCGVSSIQVDTMLLRPSTQLKTGWPGAYSCPASGVGDAPTTTKTRMERNEVILGVDTHLDAHFGAVISER
jgi:hypothetical protein